MQVGAEVVVDFDVLESLKKKKDVQKKKMRWKV
jgi:hypothetical protein